MASLNFFDIFWLVIFIFTLMPMFKLRRLTRLRLRAFEALQDRRRARLITLIHRQESLSFLGIPFRRFIDIEDSEQVLRAIRLTPDEMPIDFLLHTPGGLVLATEQIAMALRKHKGKVTVMVPHYAMSGGTMLALAADEIMMDENAVLGPVDPQLGNFPAASILKAVEQKDKNKVDDETLILADVAAKAMAQVEAFLVKLLEDRMDEEKARQIARTFSEGRWTHDYPITFDALLEMGLPVRTGLPKEVYELMELYPQPPQQRPSVQYIPIPRPEKDFTNEK